MYDACSFRRDAAGIWLHVHALNSILESNNDLKNTMLVSSGSRGFSKTLVWMRLNSECVAPVLFRISVAQPNLDTRMEPMCDAELHSADALYVRSNFRIVIN